jgi:hypothetical protein
MPKNLDHTERERARRRMEASEETQGKPQP